MRERIANIDLQNVLRWLTIYAQEVARSQSAPTVTLLPQDVARWQGYFDQTLASISHFAQRPPVDAPQTHDDTYPVPAWPYGEEDVANGLPDSVENPNAIHVINALRMLYQEGIGCQSADRATGIEVADRTRLDAIANSEKIFLAAVAQRNDDPGLDIPETNSFQVGASTE